MLSALILVWAAAAIPATEAETLAGAKVSLPQVLGGKPAILIWSFSREGGAKVKEWMETLERDAPGQAYSVAMLEAAPRLIRGMIRSGMRGDTPPALRARTLLLYKGEREWRERLGVKDAALPVTTVLNAAGEVVWSRSGACTPGLAAEALAVLRR
jgi:hypothetical protein